MNGPTSRFADLDGKTWDLEKVASAMRHAVEIRNRSSMKRLHKNCFVGSTAVGYLVSSGTCASRAKAVALGRLLQEKGYLKHASDASKFKDANLYYRFFPDDEQNHASLLGTSLGTAKMRPGVSADSKLWGFAPHTAHNSLVLNLSFAEQLEGDLQNANPAQRLQALEKLRARVRDQVNPNNPDWVAEKSVTRTVNGQRIKTKVWSRLRPRGTFTNLKTEGHISSSPSEFLNEFLDMSKQNRWDAESAKTDGTIVEAIYTPTPAAAAGGGAGATGGSGGGMKEGARRMSSTLGGGLLGLLTPKLPKPPVREQETGGAGGASGGTVVAEGEGDGSAGSGSGGGQSNNKSGLSEEVGDGNASDEDADDEATATATTGRASEVQLNNNDGGGGGDGGDDDDDDEGGGGEGGGRGSTTSGDGLDSSSSFTTLRPPEAWGGLQLDLSKCPENMSIANFGRDAKTQETLHHLQQQMSQSCVDECMHCRKPFAASDARDVHDCPSCGAVCCSFCCSKRVFEVNHSVELRVCIHCYQESSRIKHPVGTLAYASSKKKGHMDFLSMAEIRAALEEEALAEAAMEQAQEAAAAAAANQEEEEEAETDVEEDGEVEAAEAAAIASSGNLSVRESALARGEGQDGEGDDGDEEEDGESGSSSGEVRSARNSGSGKKMNGGVTGNGGGNGGLLGLLSPQAPQAANKALLPTPGTGGKGKGAALATTTATSGAAPLPPKRGVRFQSSEDGGTGGTGAVAAKMAQERDKHKWATCKQCGARVARTLDAIELHDEMCEAAQVQNGSAAAAAHPSSSTAGQQPSGVAAAVAMATGSLHGRDASSDGLHGSMHASSSHGNPLHHGESGASGSRFLLGGVPRLYPESALAEKDKAALLAAQARIIYRVRDANAIGGPMRPRQVCCLQDSFTDAATGLCCVYEISVRHRRVTGESSDHVTAEVLLLAHAARPSSTGSGAVLTVVSQVDARSKTAWISSVFGQEANCALGGLDVFNDLATDVTSVDIEGQHQQAQAALGAGASATAATGPGGEVAPVSASAPKVSLADFELMTVLGRGGFGKVMQVRHKASGDVYAMKIFKKADLRKRRQVERTKTERDILSSVRHPYIVQLSFAFQNPQKLYMVMDFVQGGDFFTLMRKFGKLRSSWVQLYICQIALALQHLHELDVVYRDLKPENVLMDGEGHAKLTDFGLSRSFDKRPALEEDLKKALNDAAASNKKAATSAPPPPPPPAAATASAAATGEGAAAASEGGGSSEEVASGTNLMTRSYCGTEQYMAPEMLLQRGHGRVVDWWCLGLLMHEMLTGRHPFQGASHYDTLRAMVTAEPTIDPRLSPTARALLRRLLIKDPKRRLGAQRGAWIELRPHPFFQGLDWDLVLKRQVPAPYKPTVSGETGVENFEEMFTREKPVDSVVAPEKKKTGLFGGFFGGAAAKSKAEDDEEDKDFEGFSFHGDGSGKSVLD